METGQIKRKEVPFSQVSNNALRDEKLSLKSKGLYALIQSYITIPGFILYKTTLMKQCKESKNTFDTAWKELKDNGYLMQYKKSNPKNKTFYYEYELLDNKIEIATTQKAIPGKTSTRETGSYNNIDLSNTDLNNIEKHNIKGVLSNDKTHNIRYESKEQFLNDLKPKLNSNEYKVLNCIYNYFHNKLNCNHYKLDNEQIEKINLGVDLILEKITTLSQLDILLKNYFYLERQYYSIQDFTNLNTLAYLMSITEIAQITERFDADGKFQGVM